MPTLADQLAQMAAAMNIAGVPGTAQPGQLVTASLAPPLTPLHFTDVVPTDISLDFIAKEVVFSNANIASPTFVEDPAIAKIKPLFNFLTVPPTTDASGVGGLIGKIKGTIPLPIPVEAIPKLTVNGTCRMRAATTWSTAATILHRLGSRTRLSMSCSSQASISSPVVRSPDDPTNRSGGDIDRGAGGRNGDHRARDNRPPTIPFPKVLALALHQNFQGAALIMVPGNSAITTVNHIKALLQPVRNVISTLTTVARFAEMLSASIRSRVSSKRRTLPSVKRPRYTTSMISTSYARLVRK